MTDWFLVVHETGQEPVEVPLAGELTVGRADDNTVVLKDPRAGRHHLRIVEEPDGFVVVDLGSASKTRVSSGETLGEGQRCLLEPGMILQVGETKIECVAPSGVDSQGTIRTGGPFAQAGRKKGGTPKGSFRATLTPIEPPPGTEAPGAPAPAPQPRDPAPAGESGGTVKLSAEEGQKDLHLQDALDKLRPRLVLIGAGVKRIADVNRPRYTIGRSETSHLSLLTKSISTNHASILFDGTNFFLQDEGSTNGTSIGDSKLVAGDRAQLSDESRLKIGGIDALFFLCNPQDSRQRQNLQSRASGLLVKSKAINSRDRREALRLAKEEGIHVGETLLMQTSIGVADWLDAVEKAEKSRGWRLF